MKQKILVLLVFLLLCTTLAYAQLSYFLEDLDKAKEEYNSHLDEVPGFMKKIAGNERINLNIKLENGDTAELGIVTKKGEVISAEKEALDKPTLEIYTNETVINDLMYSEHQIKDLRKALKTKAIHYKAVRIRTKAKAFFARTYLAIRSWFKK